MAGRIGRLLCALMRTVNLANGKNSTRELYDRSLVDQSDRGRVTSAKNIRSSRANGSPPVERRDR